MAQPINVTDYLLEGKEPEAIALRTLQGNHSYGEVARGVAQLTGWLAETQHSRDRILLIADNSLFWVTAYLAMMKAGLISVPLPPSTTCEQLEYISRVTGATAAFVQSKFLAGRAAQFAGMRIVTERDRFVAQGSGARPTILPPVEPDDLAAIMFTSGSTGEPRGVMVSHRNIVANTESIVEYLRLTASDRILAVLPFHYCFGTSLLHSHLRVGASLVVEPRFLYPEVVLQRMADTECTGFAGVPSHFQILLRRSSLKRRTFPHLRYVQQAGGHLAPVFIRELREALPTSEVFIMYGQTEATARLSYLPPESLDSRLGSIGKGIPGVKLEVLNPEGSPVAPGEVGEIVATGDNVACGYWRSPEESAHCFREGRLYTGDLATVDGDGFIFVVDRSKDFLKCGGIRVSCRQLEDQLLEDEELLEAAVVGIPDEVYGEAVKCFAVPREAGCAATCCWGVCRAVRDRLVQHCKAHMPPKLVPREIVLLKALPKNGSGKVAKSELRNSNS